MELFLITAAITLGGLIKGLNGFGYALVSTSILASFMPAQQAVTLMIIPLLVANIELTAKLSAQELKACFKRFRSYILASFIGVGTGMALIDYIPSLILKKAVGVLILVFVASKLPKVSQLFSRGLSFCAENPRIEPVLGFLSGLVFGSSNTGVLNVAYFQKLELPREKFISMVALTVLGASVLRIGLASYLGLYKTFNSILLSAGLGIIGLMAVKTGDLIGEKFPEKITTNTSLILLVIIGLKLLGTF